MLTNLNDKSFIVIDLGSGKYTLSNPGHEIFNLERNAVSNTYLGYCPSNDDIDTRQLGAKSRDFDVEHVMVIYVQKLEKSNNRKIVAFTDDAKIYAHPITNTKYNRKIKVNGKIEHCSYTIESCSLHNLTYYSPKFVINISDYSYNMFHRQRFYKGKYPKLDKKIIGYLEEYLEHLDTDEDFDFQKEVNETDCYEHYNGNDANEEPMYTTGLNGFQVAKKTRVSKQALKIAGFKCIVDENHTTFMTSKNLPYMEGHHLIPCTVANTDFFWKKYKVNIDCVENIVCLCPTCHRRIHYGSPEEKINILKFLYKKQIKELEKIGLNISFDDLLNLYI